MPGLLNSTRSRRVVVIAALAALFGGVQLNNIKGECGGKRWWSMKILTDTSSTYLDADDVSMRAQTQTIEFLNKIPREKRIKGTRTEEETKTYWVKNVRIDKVISEDDEDLHLILKDNKGNTLIGEIPYWDCPSAKESGYWKKYKAARISLFTHDYTIKGQLWDVKGVAFFDFEHTQTGGADNNFELHPILELKPHAKP